MGVCQDAVNTLDPFQIILDATDKTVGTLERQSRDILPFVTQFREEGLAFPSGNISDPGVVDTALAAFTKEAICASKTNLEPINSFVEDCLNDALRAVRRYLGDILENVENGIDLIDDILALAEALLMKLLQKIWVLCADIYRLISAIDRKLQCVTDAGYQDQVDALSGRVEDVIDDLYLDEQGNFDHERLMTGFEQDLFNNLDSYYDRSVELQSEINADVEDVINIPSTINPRSKF